MTCEAYRVVFFSAVFHGIEISVSIVSLDQRLVKWSVSARARCVTGRQALIRLSVLHRRRK